MPEGTLQIVTPSLEEIKSHKGNTRYKVEISADGDATEEPAAGEESAVPGDVVVE